MLSVSDLSKDGEERAWPLAYSPSFLHADFISGTKFVSTELLCLNLLRQCVFSFLVFHFQLHNTQIILIHGISFTTHLQGFVICIQIQDHENLELHLKIGFASGSVDVW